MTALDLSLIRKTASGRTSQERPATFSLDRMTALQLAKRTVIFNVDAASIASLVDAAREDIPGLTSNQMFQSVANHNPDTFWAIAKRDRFNIACLKGDGFLAVLPDGRVAVALHGAHAVAMLDGGSARRIAIDAIGVAAGRTDEVVVTTPGRVVRMSSR